jgi:hypothetical protein
MTSQYSLFGQCLVERSIISQEQLDEAVKLQETSKGHKMLGEILIRLGYLSERHITVGLADQLGIPLIRLSEREIDEGILQLMTGSTARLYRVIPIEEQGNTLIIAISDPTALDTLETLSKLLDRPVWFALSSAEEIDHALSTFYDD